MTWLLQMWTLLLPLLLVYGEAHLTHLSKPVLPYSTLRSESMPSVSDQQKQLSRASLSPYQQPAENRNQHSYIIPDGDKIFQFYVYGQRGQLEKKALTLQQVQDMLLLVPGRCMGEEEVGFQYYSASGVSSKLDDQGLNLPPRPLSNVQGIVDSVQQMVSSEVAHKPSDQLDESIDIPDTILQNLMGGLPTHISNQWQFLSTFSPPQTTYPPTTQDTEQPLSTMTFESTGSEESITTESSTRWNSRLPIWGTGELNQEETATETTESEPTGDYHSSLDSFTANTEVPSNNIVYQESDDLSYASQTKISHNVHNADEDPLLLTLTDLYAQSYNGDLPPRPSESIQSTTNSFKVVDMTGLTDTPDIDTTTMPFHTTFVDFANDVLQNQKQSSNPTETQSPNNLENSPSLTSYLPTVAESSIDDSQVDENYLTTIWIEPTTTSQDEIFSDTEFTTNENLLTLDIRDPGEPQSPYDIAVDKVASTTNVPGDISELPTTSDVTLSPYDALTTLLEIIEPGKTTPTSKDPDNEDLENLLLHLDLPEESLSTIGEDPEDQYSIIREMLTQYYTTSSTTTPDAEEPLTQVNSTSTNSASSASSTVLASSTTSQNLMTSTEFPTVTTVQNLVTSPLDTENHLTNTNSSFLTTKEEQMTTTSPTSSFSTASSDTTTTTKTTTTTVFSDTTNEISLGTTSSSSTNESKRSTTAKPQTLNESQQSMTDSQLQSQETTQSQNSQLQENIQSQNSNENTQSQNSQENIQSQKNTQSQNSHENIQSQKNTQSQENTQSQADTQTQNSQSQENTQSQNSQSQNSQSQEITQSQNSQTQNSQSQNSQTQADTQSITSSTQNSQTTPSDPQTQANLQDASNSDIIDPTKNPELPNQAGYYSHQASVLPSSQLGGSSYQDRIDLESLQGEGNHTEGDSFYDYYGSSVYLDNIPAEYYDYDTGVTQPPPITGDTDQLGFPDRNATSPHHHHHHHDKHHDHHDKHHHHHDHHHKDHHPHHHGPPENAANLLKAPEDNPGLEASTEGLDNEIRQFVDVMNDITFKVYKQAARQHRGRNFVMSPLSLVSTLGMLLLGARGVSSSALSDLLHIQQFYTFNPHLVLKNVTQAVHQLKDVHDVAFLSQFLVETEKNPYSTDFFARAINVFYDAVIEDAPPSQLDKRVREMVNAVISNRTKGRVPEFLSVEEELFLTPPLTSVATSFLHAKWSQPVNQQDLLDMNFIRFPTAERRLINTVGLKKKMTINAGFSRAAEATSAEIPLYSKSGELSLVLVMPGEQKNFVANGLTRMESTLTPDKWSTILRSMLPNTVHLKMPVFRHRAFHNFSNILSDLGLSSLFKEGEADFSGINHIKNLHLSDVVQLTEFQSCQIDGTPSSEAENGVGSRMARSGLGKNQYDHPTFIYGYPMMEYMQKDKFKNNRMESGMRVFLQPERDGNREPTARRSDLPEEHNPSQVGYQGNKLVDTENNMGKPQELPVLNNVDKTEHKSITHTTHSPKESTKTPQLSYPDYYNYHDYDYPSDYDYRVDRMGVAANNDDNAGLHYRQSDVGTLAFDRAFFYAVRHNPTGLLLFLGRYLDPEGN